jgi:hypothetical protein
LTEQAGYSGTSLVKKLGIKEGFEIGLIGAPPGYKSLLTGLPDKVKWRAKINGHALDMIHLFVINKETFINALTLSKNAIKKSGTIWVSWPKGTSGMPTDLNENIIRAIALDIGLVDVKVCAIDSVWSGLKLVYRLKDRG